MCSHPWPCEIDGIWNIFVVWLKAGCQRRRIHRQWTFSHLMPQIRFAWYISWVDCVCILLNLIIFSPRTCTRHTKRRTQSQQTKTRINHRKRIFLEGIKKFRWNEIYTTYNGCTHHRDSVIWLHQHFLAHWFPLCSIIFSDKSNYSRSFCMARLSLEVEREECFRLQCKWLENNQRMWNEIGRNGKKRLGQDFFSEGLLEQLWRDHVYKSNKRTFLEHKAT